MNRATPALRGFLWPALALAVLTIAGAAHAHTRVAAETATCPRAALHLASVAAPRTYDDIVEETAGPDICQSNVVTNDNVGVVIGIHMHNRSRFQLGDAYSVFLDTDRSAATGSNGAEYLVRIVDGGATLQRFNGTMFEPTAASVTFSWADDYGPLITFLRSDLPATAFDFFLEAENVQGRDRAPDAGSWAYDLRPLRLNALGLALSPARAGRVFTASMRVIRSDWNIELDEGRVRCRAKLGRSSLRGRGAFKAGRLVCSWRLPKSAAGRLVTGSLGTSFQGADASRSFRVRVRR
jgi:hypothetical protein